MSRASKLFDSPKMFSFIIFLAKYLPKKVMIFLADLFIKALLRSSYPGLEAIESNLKVLLGRDLDEKEVKMLAKEILHNQAKYLYDVFHFYSKPDKILDKVYVSEEDRAKARTFIEEKRGAIIVGPHYGNFDLCLIAIGLLGIEGQVLSIANPNADYQIQNNIRQVENLDVTPITIKSLIAASRRLRSGGTVITGVDRPIPDGEQSYQFFNKPSKMPDGHVRLAIKNDVPIFILYSKNHGNGYQLMVSDSIYMEIKETKNESIRFNTEKILKMLEEIIEKDPLNWMMFYPVWDK